MKKLLLLMTLLLSFSTISAQIEICKPCYGSGMCTTCRGNGMYQGWVPGYNCSKCQGNGRCWQCKGAKRVRYNSYKRCWEPFYSNSSTSGNSSYGNSYDSEGSGSNYEKCKDCYGMGDCRRCHGMGHYNYAGYDIECVNCHGRKFCPRCNGAGYRPKL